MAQLHPLAASEDEAGGRIYPEDEHYLRSCFQRDRDRIIHSRAFRRLEYKTQVFVNHEGDHYRTRLTHTIEVSQIARTIARALGFNEDLAETIALGHDLGHPPFGHAGERVLNELTERQGGFEHNKQTVRVLEFLERRYPMFNGLNLTRLTLRGLMKHGGLYKDSALANLLKDYPRPPLESRISDLADSIAYNCHDLDDGISGGYLSYEQLDSLAIWRHFYTPVHDRYPNERMEIRVRYTIRNILSYLVEELVANSRRLLDEAARDFSDYNDYSQHSPAARRLIAFEQPAAAMLAELKLFLRRNLYRHYRVVRMSNRGQVILGELFSYFQSSPLAMPENFRPPTLKAGSHSTAGGSDAVLTRCITDYLAGMTDRYAISEHHRLMVSDEL